MGGRLRRGGRRFDGGVWGAKVFGVKAAWWKGS